MAIVHGKIRNPSSTDHLIPTILDMNRVPVRPEHIVTSREEP